MGILCMQSGAVSADAYKSASDVNTNILIPNPSTGIQSFNFILEWEFMCLSGESCSRRSLPMTATHLLMLPTANVLTQTSADIVKPVAQPVVLPQVAPEFCSLYINNFKYISTAKNEYTIPSNACMAKSYAAGSVVTVNFSAIYTLAVVFTAEGVYVFSYTGLSDHSYSTGHTTLTSLWYMCHMDLDVYCFLIPAVQSFSNGTQNPNFLLSFYSDFFHASVKMVFEFFSHFVLTSYFFEFFSHFVLCFFRNLFRTFLLPPSYPQNIYQKFITAGVIIL
ncbi:hypothetical protein EIN_004340 [Entamoeba invadens IP1]|uniref:Uncharacterized protein n=1 Tax=Entamoeba invadens IP1 TaxID=370355 RepID=L7FLA1_ENTIV|nr:hypothetical protein EIN_004340 [Entamoeba invadens IP1]ELP86387.1 hypothetical protein EIN_004340 [Entamoeba invadens IP1]|eukprot:XP_004185733.1 hypothetical protein EIN_004340 [Entamoeba invadens IP1]